jgi:1-acyl-sn-glycerol-3-phosphate acyltransferase
VLGFKDSMINSLTSPAGEINLFIFRVTRAIVRLFLHLLFRIQVTGLENIPERGSFILLPKHQRWEDIALLGVTFQKSLYYVAKYELFERPVRKWLLLSLGGVPLNRERPLESRQSLKIMLRLLEEGAGVVIFPEGTYYREKMGPVQRGLLRMVINRMEVPLIPAGIRYSKGGWRTLVTIKIGRPLNENPSMSVDGVMNIAIKDIARLSGL